MRTRNPALKTNTFGNFRKEMQQASHDQSQMMTVQGTINKTGFLLLLVVVAFAFVWSLAMQGSPLVTPLMIGGGIGAFLVSMLTIFKKNWAHITAPLYAVLEGFLLGGISYSFDVQYPGLPIWAAIGTFSVLFTMLGLFTTGVIKVDKKFKSILMTAMGAIFFVYLAQMILSMFGTQIPMLFNSGMVGIGFSVVVVGIAAFSLMLDFDFIVKGSESGLPKKVEWYAAFSLILGLVWLYLEILRLLSKISSRD